MQAHPITSSLPTFDKLGVSPPKDVDAEKVGRAWVEQFGKAVSAKDIKGILATMGDEPWWRDIFALTWDLRTFQGPAKISQFLQDRLGETQPTNVAFKAAQFSQPFPDMAWIIAQFTFETKLATGTGLARLVPTKDGWRAAIVCTNLEDLKDYPEAIGPRRKHEPSHGKWSDEREKDQEFKDHDPEVLIIGGGQSGLDIAARLKHLGVSHLIVEKQPRIGNQWRHRYEALCLHDPVCEYILTPVW